MGVKLLLLVNVAEIHHLSPKKSYRGADKYLARPERKQVTATEDLEFHISYSLSQLEEY